MNLNANARCVIHVRWRWTSMQVVVRELNFVVLDAVWSSHVNEPKSMSLIAVLHDKNDEIIVTDEGFQVIRFTEDFQFDVKWRVQEKVDPDSLFIRLTNPATGINYSLQLGNAELKPGSEVAIKAQLLEALKHEQPTH